MAVLYVKNQLLLSIPIPYMQRGIISYAHILFSMLNGFECPNSKRLIEKTTIYAFWILSYSLLGIQNKTSSLLLCYNFIVILCGLAKDF